MDEGQELFGDGINSTTNEFGEVVGESCIGEPSGEAVGEEIRRRQAILTSRSFSCKLTS